MILRNDSKWQIGIVLLGDFIVLFMCTKKVQDRYLMSTNNKKIEKETDVNKYIKEDWAETNTVNLNRKIKTWNKQEYFY